MTNWRDYADADALATSVATEVAAIIRQALAARDQAIVAFPGGTSPLLSFERLARSDLDWEKVTILPSDDRLVETSHPLSNYSTLVRCFVPVGACVVPLVVSPVADHRAAGAASDAGLASLPWPLDLVWLGVGADGHTASIFPGPDLDDALDAPSERRAVGLLPVPLPPDAPVARVTLTRSAIVSARQSILTLAGTAKRAVLERAIAEGGASSFPIGRVLAALDRPIIHWSAS